MINSANYIDILLTINIINFDSLENSDKYLKTKRKWDGWKTMYDLHSSFQILICCWLNELYWSAKVVLFPVVTHGYESWTIKKAEHWRIDAFELWCWRRLLRVPWTAGRSNQSIFKEINPEYSLEGLML